MTIVTKEQTNLTDLIRKQWVELGLTDEEFIGFFDPTWSAFTLDGLARTLHQMLLAQDAGAFEVCNGKSKLPILEQCKAGNNSCFESLMNNWVNSPLLA
jgi:hypothetical protein